MILLFIKLLAGLALILIGANYLVEGSSAVARRFGISEFVVGMTIVGIGTSTPEMVVSFIASINSASDIAVGNIVGSNIANVFLILGVTAMVAPIALTRNNLRRDIPICLGASLLLFIFGMDQLLFCSEINIISRLEGVIFLIGFILFMIYSFRSGSSDNSEAADEPVKKRPMWLATIFILGGLYGLILGGRIFVNSGSAIASFLGVSDAFIGITVMALGTSMPELAASVVAAVKGKGQMALGNIVGSNISNIFLILGGAALINPLTLSNITLVDMSMMVFSTLVMFIANSTFQKKSIDRIEGGVFVLIYIAYIVYLAMNL